MDALVLAPPLAGPLPAPTLRAPAGAARVRPAGPPPASDAEAAPASDRPAAGPAPVADARRRAEDAALLARIADGDERAVEELYARYAGPLYSLAYQVTRTERFAQDVVQEVFIAVWGQAGRYDPSRGPVGPWLFSLARHKAIDLIRREATVRRRTADVDLELREADDDVDEEAWLGVRRERVRAAVRLLAAPQREALELAFFEGLTHVQVAEALGIPLGTAKTRIRTALIRLRDILGDSVSELPAGQPAR